MDLTDYKSTFENGKVAVCQEVNLEFLKPFETSLESFGGEVNTGLINNGLNLKHFCAKSATLMGNTFSLLQLSCD